MLCFRPFYFAFFLSRPADFVPSVSLAPFLSVSLPTSYLLCKIFLEQFP